MNAKNRCRILHLMFDYNDGCNQLTDSVNRLKDAVTAGNTGAALEAYVGLQQDMALIFQYLTNTSSYDS